MHPRVLVLCDAAQPPGEVESRLAASAIAYACLDIGRVARAEAPVSYHLDAAGASCLRFRDARTGQAVDTGELRGVWAETVKVGRHPGLSSSIDMRDDETAYMDVLGQNEAWLHAIAVRGFLASRFLYLPQQLERNRANLPLYQLAAARDAGFAMVPTYVGESYAVYCHRLGAERGQPVHYQPLVPYRFRVADTELVGVDRWIERDRLFAMAYIRGPVVLSRRPQPGRRLVVAEISGTQMVLEVTLVDSELDAQVTDLYFQAAQDNLACAPVALPEPAAALVRGFMRETGLVYAVLDLLEIDGDVYFLAAHPGGSLSLFEEAGLPAYDTLVDVLARGSRATEGAAP